MPRDWIASGLRVTTYKLRSIYFREDEKKVVIVRVVHGARNIENIDFDDE